MIKAIFKLFFIVFLLALFNQKLYALLKTEADVVEFYALTDNLEEIIFGINIKEYSNTLESVISYIDLDDEDVAYIPLNDFLRILKFPVKPVNNDDFILEGYFLSRKNEVSIDLYKQVASSKGVKTQIKNEDVKINNNGDVYISKQLLSVLFDISIFIDMPKLILKIETESKLQIDFDFEKYKDKELIEERTLYEKNYKEDIDINNFERQDPLFLINNINIVNQFSYYKNESIKKYKTNNIANNTSLYTGGIIFGLDTKAYYYTKADRYYGNKSQAGLTVSKPYPAESWYGVKTFYAADTNAINTNGIISANTRRGFYLSSLNDYGVNEDQTITISGIVQNGWEVELYKYNTLIDFKKNDNNGDQTFSFTTDQVSAGPNEFALVYIGPFGEIKREVKRFYIGNNPVKKHEIAVKTSYGQNGRKTIELEKSKAGSDKISGETLVFLGITDNFTGYVGYFIQDSPNIELRQRKEVFHFFNNGYIFNFLGISNNSSVFLNSTKNEYGFNSSVSGNLGFGNMYTSYTYFGLTNTYKSFNSGLFLKQQAEFRYSHSIQIKSFVLPISTSYRYNDYNKESTVKTQAHEVIVRTSQFLFNKLFINIENTWTDRMFNKQELITNKGNITASSNFSDLGLQAKTNYNTIPNSNFEDYELSLTYRYKNMFSVGVGYKHLFKAKEKDNSYLNLGYKTKYGAFSLNNNFTNNKNFSVELTYSLSLSYNSVKRSISFSGDTLINSEAGKIIATAFIDKNQNGLFDKDEDLINDVSLLINNTENDNLASNGEIVLTGIGSYEKLQININEATLGEINLSYTKPEKKLLLRPNVARNLAFPIYLVSLIEGRLYQNKDKTNVIRNSKISLVNLKNEEVAVAYTDRDGNFDMTNVPYGDYKIVLVDLNKNSKETNSFTINEEVVSRIFFIKDANIKLPAKATKTPKPKTPIKKKAPAKNNSKKSTKAPVKAKDFAKSKPSIKPKATVKPKVIPKAQPKVQPKQTPKVLPKKESNEPNKLNTDEKILV